MLGSLLRVFLGAKMYECVDPWVLLQKYDRAAIVKCKYPAFLNARIDFVKNRF